MLRLKAAVNITDTSNIPTMKTEFGRMGLWQEMNSYGMAQREESIQYAMLARYKEGIIAKP
jgi:hypothetical protein